MHRILHYESVDSTNERLKAVAAQSPDGLVISADEQTLGKGRLGRKWVSDKGQGAWFSLLVKRDGIDKSNAGGLVFVCAIAAYKSLSMLTKRADIRIKWPNDIVLNGKKLAGILCESGFDGDRISWSVCGIGINLTAEHFPPELPWAASVRNETGIWLSADDVINAFLKEFDEALNLLISGGLAAVLDEISPISATIGKTVEADMPSGKITGRATGFEESGALIIETQSGPVSVNVGDVSVRGIMGYTD